MEHPKFKAGDRIKDLTFDPPSPGAIVQPHETRADAYLVRLDGSTTTVVIHARNLAHG